MVLRKFPPAGGKHKGGGLKLKLTISKSERELFNSDVSS